MSSTPHELRRPSSLAPFFAISWIGPVGPAGLRVPDRRAAVALANGLLEPDRLTALLEGEALGAVARDAVEDGRDHLRRGEPHVVVGLVDHELLHHELVLGHARHALRPALDGLIEIGRR